MILNVVSIIVAQLFIHKLVSILKSGNQHENPEIVLLATYIWDNKRGLLSLKKQYVCGKRSLYSMTHVAFVSKLLFSKTSFHLAITFLTFEIELALKCHKTLLQGNN